MTETTQAPARSGPAATGVARGLAAPRGEADLALRQARWGFVPSLDDPVIPGALAQRLGLRPGHEVEGRLEGDGADEGPVVAAIERVDGLAPEVAARKPALEGLTRRGAGRRLHLAGRQGVEGPLVRAVDALAPLALGGRLRIAGARGAGRSRAFAAVVRALGERLPDARLVLLLAHGRPEEVTAWRRSAPRADVLAAPGELDPTLALVVVDLALARVARLVEAGRDVILGVDALDLLARELARAPDPLRGRPAPGPLRGRLEALTGSWEGAGSVTLVAVDAPHATDGAKAERPPPVPRPQGGGSAVPDLRGAGRSAHAAAAPTDDGAAVPRSTPARAPWADLDAPAPGPEEAVLALRTGAPGAPPAVDLAACRAPVGVHRTPDEEALVAALAAAKDEDAARALLGGPGS